MRNTVLLAADYTKISSIHESNFCISMKILCVVLQFPMADKFQLSNAKDCKLKDVGELDTHPFRFYKPGLLLERFSTSDACCENKLSFQLLQSPNQRTTSYWHK